MFKKKNFQKLRKKLLLNIFESVKNRRKNIMIQ